MPRSALCARDGVLQVLQIGGDGGIGMVVGEMAVHFEEQLGDFAVQPLEQAMHHGPGGAVAGIGDHLDAPLEIELRRDFVQIRAESRPCSHGCRGPAGNRALR